MEKKNDILYNTIFQRANYIGILFVYIIIVNCEKLLYTRCSIKCMMCVKRIIFIKRRIFRIYFIYIYIYVNAICFKIEIS